MELNFSSDFDSAKRLDEIMNSYSGRDRGSILADEHSLAVTLFLLEYGKITVTEHIYWLRFAQCVLRLLRRFRVPLCRPRVHVVLPSQLHIAQPFLSVTSDVHPLYSFHFLTPFPGSFSP